MNFSSHGLSFYYEQTGNGKKNACVILPGWGNTRDTFSNIIEKISVDHTTYIFDYPSFGNSSLPARELTIYDYALLVKEFIEYEELVDPILIGHSFGGRLIILLLGYYHVPCKKAILIDSAGIIPKKTIKSLIKRYLYKFLKSLVVFISNNKKQSYLDYLIDKYSSDDYKALKPQMRRTFSNIVSENLFPFLKEIQSSVLILWGEYDASTPLKDGLIMEKEIKDSALITIKNGSHFPYLDQPYLVGEIIKSFIKE